MVWMSPRQEDQAVECVAQRHHSRRSTEPQEQFSNGVRQPHAAGRRMQALANQPAQNTLRARLLPRRVRKPRQTTAVYENHATALYARQWQLRSTSTRSRRTPKRRVREQHQLLRHHTALWWYIRQQQPTAESRSPPARWRNEPLSVTQRAAAAKPIHMRRQQPQHASMSYSQNAQPTNRTVNNNDRAGVGPPIAFPGRKRSRLRYKNMARRDT
jgi:hypothetical protein